MSKLNIIKDNVNVIFFSKYGHFGTKIKYVRPLVRPPTPFKECHYHIKDGFRYSAILEKPATGFFGTFGTVVR